MSYNTPHHAVFAQTPGLLSNQGVNYPTFSSRACNAKGGVISSSNLTEQRIQSEAAVLQREKALRQQQYRILYAILGLSSLLWLGARANTLGDVSLWPFRAPSQLAMLWASSLAVLAMVVVVRANAIETLFGGLGQAVRWHRRLGLMSIVFLGVHVALLAADAAINGISVAFVLLPFSSPGQRSLDIVLFYLLMVLGALAYDRRLRHEKWLKLHRMVGILYIAGIIHASIEPGSIRNFEPLRTWFVIMLLVGAGAWSYNVLLFRRVGPVHRYVVNAVRPHGRNIIDLILTPSDRRMMFSPGAFVLIRVPSFKGMEGELHPFSIASSPVERDVQLSIQQVGDFTRRLSYLSLGEDHPEYWLHRRKGKHHAVSTLIPQEVHLYGPFGGFSPLRFTGYRRLVWIAFGIGVTPFLSMLKFEQHNIDFRRVWFYYLVREPDDAIYAEQIEQLCEHSDSYIDLTVWTSAEHGRLTAAQIADDVGFDDYAVMMCGTRRSIESLSSQFKELGLPSERIISEELQFRYQSRGG